MSPPTSSPNAALVDDPGSARTGQRVPRLKRRIARTGVIALALAAFTGPTAAAEDPAEALRLTRLAGSEPAPAFSVATPDGSALALGDLRGKVVLLNFWATWCEPCLEEMPALERLAQTYHARGLLVLALSMDREGASVVRPFLKRHGLTLPIGLDPQQAVARLYRIWALPSTLILSRSGVPLFAVQGGRVWDSPAAHTLFDSLLNQGS
jgi:peroxiredoxin